MQFHKIWTEQCAATRIIKEQYGIQNALSYVIGEKLMRFVAAAEDHPEFAQQLPQFLSEIRSIFTPEEIDEYLDSFEHQKILAPVPEYDEEEEGETADDLLDNPVTTAEEILRFARIRTMLQAGQ